MRLIGGKQKHTQTNARHRDLLNTRTHCVTGSCDDIILAALGGSRHPDLSEQTEDAPPLTCIIHSQEGLRLSHAPPN